MQILNINTLQEQKKVKLFKCCSYNMKNFLIANGFMYVNVTQVFNKKKRIMIDCWNFIETEELNKYRKEWTERKANGNLYYKKGEISNGK